VGEHCPVSHLHPGARPRRQHAGRHRYRLNDRQVEQRVHDLDLDVDLDFDLDLNLDLDQGTLTTERAAVLPSQRQSRGVARR